MDENIQVQLARIEEGVKSLHALLATLSTDHALTKARQDNHFEDIIVLKQQVDSLTDRHRLLMKFVLAAFGSGVLALLDAVLRHLPA